jgi:hypothetical protein
MRAFGAASEAKAAHEFKAPVGAILAASSEPREAGALALEHIGQDLFGRRKQKIELR